MRGFLNSIFYAVAGTAVNVVLTLLAAYPLSRQDLRGRGWIMFFFFFTTLFSGGLIPTYLVVRDLGLLNTRWALILPAALSVWNVIITRTYFQATIPDELLDAARIDGASDFRFLRDVVLPLSGPIVAVNALFYAVGHWNAYFDALIYLNDESLYPLQLVLRQILVQNQTNLQMTGDIQSMLAPREPGRSAQVRADRGGHRAAAARLPVRAKALRQGRPDRVPQGLGGAERCGWPRPSDGPTAATPAARPRPDRARARRGAQTLASRSSAAGSST